MKETLLGVACELGGGKERKKSISMFGASLKSNRGKDKFVEPRDKNCEDGAQRK